MSTTTTAHKTKWWSGGKSPFNLEYGKVMMWYFLMSDAFTFGAFLISYGSIRFSQNFWPDPNVVFNAFPGAGHANLPLAFVSVMTFILIISSVTMVLAVHAGHKGDKAGVIKWMFWTIIGGLAFLGCQAWEWHHLITGEHAVLADGQIEMIGQTMGGNPWGNLVHDNAALTAALNNTPHETLVQLVHSHDHSKTAAELTAMTDVQLRGMVDLTEMHVREKGPIAFGGYFYGITGFHGFHVFSGVVINIIMLIMTQKDVFKNRGHYLMIEKAGLYWHFVDLVWVFVFLCFYLI
ncbi:MAG: cytochrome c oxidase subunit 3 [Chitinophagaceae bacterium]|nr:cytochrome c oxidase subunit 3 [Chitinophagaceae bacterium]MBK8312432.1 cytochrome c oxidase subunit 3 [Chitinophagaceae bacterium]MBK8606272.1 cytochrome c oxidase subunit 3 [Chitinophagaceae bacterium]MBP6477579.1 cytochrome c oxidase subunit 3 [Chitinophagaceae bacterium]MBP7109242.1 cytochrome c oxidase subunit 3 [Chitinophagaceae bacterium]